MFGEGVGRGESPFQCSSLCVQLPASEETLSLRISPGSPFPDLASQEELAGSLGPLWPLPDFPAKHGGEMPWTILLLAAGESEAPLSDPPRLSPLPLSTLPLWGQKPVQGLPFEGIEEAEPWADGFAHEPWKFSSSVAFFLFGSSSPPSLRISEISPLWSQLCPHPMTQPRLVSEGSLSAGAGGGST